MCSFYCASVVVAGVGVNFVIVCVIFVNEVS